MLWAALRQLRSRTATKFCPLPNVLTSPISSIFPRIHATTIGVTSAAMDRIVAELAAATDSATCVAVLESVRDFPELMAAPASKAKLIAAGQRVLATRPDVWAGAAAASFGRLLTDMNAIAASRAGGVGGGAGGAGAGGGHDATSGHGGADGKGGSADGGPTAVNEKDPLAAVFNCAPRFYNAAAGGGSVAAYGNDEHKVTCEESIFKAADDGSSLCLRGFGNLWWRECRYDLREDGCAYVRMEVELDETEEAMVAFSENMANWGEADPAPDALTFRVNYNGDIWVRTGMYRTFVHTARCEFGAGRHILQVALLRVAGDIKMVAELDGKVVVDHDVGSDNSWQRAGVMGFCHYGGGATEVTRWAWSTVGEPSLPPATDGASVKR